MTVLSSLIAALVACAIGVVLHTSASVGLSSSFEPSSPLEGISAADRAAIHDLSNPSVAANSVIVVAGAWRAPRAPDNNGLFSIPLWVPDLPPAGNFTSEISTLTRAFQLRLDRAVELAVALRVPRLMLTGGLNDALVSRAYIIRRYGVDVAVAGDDAEAWWHRLETDDSAAATTMTVKLQWPRTEHPPLAVELVVETESRTTEENAKFAAAMLVGPRALPRDAQKPPQPPSRIIVVSTPGHGRRCLIYFRRELARLGFPTAAVRFVGSRADTFEWVRPRGWLVPVSGLTHRDVQRCFHDGSTLPSRAVQAAHAVLSEPASLALCAAARTCAHHAFRNDFTLQSVPILFELREWLALAANVAAGKMTVAEVLQFS